MSSSPFQKASTRHRAENSARKRHIGTLILWTLIFLIALLIWKVSPFVLIKRKYAAAPLRGFASLRTGQGATQPSTAIKTHKIVHKNTTSPTGTAQASARLVWMLGGIQRPQNSKNHSQTIVAALEKELNQIWIKFAAKPPSSGAMSISAASSNEALMATTNSSLNNGLLGVSEATHGKTVPSAIYEPTLSWNLSALTAIANNDAVDISNNQIMTEAVNRASLESTMPRFFGNSETISDRAGWLAVSSDHGERGNAKAENPFDTPQPGARKDTSLFLDTSMAPASNLVEGKAVVWVTSTDARRHALVKANRAWRKPLGVRAVIVTNVGHSGVSEAEAHEHLEVWSYWPDMPEGWNATAKEASDHRVAMTPLIAHRILGDSYKWMLFGGDDVIFFAGGVDRVLSSFDSDMAYLITDSLAQHDQGAVEPKRTSMRCVACNFTSSTPSTDAVSSAGVPVLRGCPCRPRDLCAHWGLHQPHVAEEVCGDAGLPDGNNPPWIPALGDSGAALSVGLLRQLKWEDYGMCLTNASYPLMGADGFMAQCIWKAGYWITGPSSTFTSPSPKEKYVFNRWQQRGARNMSELWSLLRRNSHVGRLQSRDIGQQRLCEETGSSSSSPCTVPDPEKEFLMTMASAHADHHPLFLGEDNPTRPAYDLQDKNLNAAYQMELVILSYEQYLRGMLIGRIFQGPGA